MTPADPAEARLASLDNRHGWQLGIFAVVATLMLVTLYVAAAVRQTLAAGGMSFDVDFYVFWAAARLALEGLPLDAFDVTRLQQTAGVADGDWMPWAYPPGFMMLVMPFGLLPFGVAWPVFNAAGVAALMLGMRHFTGGRWQVLLAVTFAPAMWPCLLVGQTTLLWIAGIVAALAAMRADRPWLAGVFIGLLTLKPQLGLLVPVALLACGAWRTIISASATTVALGALPTLVYGPAYWAGMLAMMRVHAETVRDDIADLTLMISPYSTFAGFGAGEPLALVLQWMLAAACALIVLIVWRSSVASFDLRAAVLLLAIPLASPYLWFYDSAFLAPAGLFMWRAGVIGPRPAGIVLGLAMWFGLGPSHLIALEIAPGLEAFRTLFAPIACLALLACLRCVLRAAVPAHVIQPRNL